jgi:Peptidase family M23
MRPRVLITLAALVADGLLTFLIIALLIVGSLVLLISLAATERADAAVPHWVAPVPGAPTRLFHYGPSPFLAGQHRGVDLAASAEPVRAACAGRVVFAGRVAGEGTVSQRCGRWRVSYAPLTRIAVREGEPAGPGTRLGRARGELHFGVRREGDRFGYVDPLRFLAGRRAPMPPVPLPVTVRPPSPRSLPLHAARLGPGLAPWPVWLGLALLLGGLVGAGRLPASKRPETATRATGAGLPTAS